ncbi:MAG: UDP-glucose 4-epimerase [Pseudozobellia sp.]|nr:UDP-glucose 4-epimerase [Pseudozobellia sp.]|tara:strand:+ start:121 stop:483 length:363 start_codon:yes stop_codon:yes gene_type:complete
MIERVLITDAAKKVVDKLREQHGELMFHQSGGCCDGSAPMCYTKGELMLNETDVLLGTVYECEFYMSQDQYEYWKHTQLTVDVVTGRGSSFSLEIPMGLRFVIKSRIFKEEELEDLTPFH